MKDENLCVSFIVRNWYDTMLGERHDASFDGAMFKDIDEIKEWQEKNPEVEIYKVLDLRTGKEIKIIS